MKKGRFVNVFPVLRYFYSMVWKHKKSYFLLAAVDMLHRILSPFINIVLPKFIIDELLGQKRPDVVAIFVGVLIGANLILSLIKNVNDYFKKEADLFLDMKFDEFRGRKAMEMDFEYTENPQVLTQLERAKAGMSWYSGGISGITGNLIYIASSFFILLGTLYIMARLSPWLVGIMLVTIALGSFAMVKSQKMHVQLMKDLVGINRRFSYYFGILMNFKYGKDIRLYDASDMLMKRVDQYIDEDWGISKERILVENRLAMTLALLNTLQLTTLYGYLGLRVLAGAISIGEFQMLVGAAGKFTESLTNISSQVIQIVKNADFMNDYKVFMEYPSVKKTGIEKPLKKTGYVLEVRDLSFKYPGSHGFVLKDVSLTIPSGQRLAVVGPNGAGKTTFVKLLTRLYDPTEGQILLDGKDIREYDNEGYMKLFAVVFQDFKLLAFSVRDNVVAGSEYDEAALEHAIDMVGLGSRIERLEKGLDTPIYKAFDKDGIEFSGGERQKMAIARAVYKDSPIVILDEPTAALDPVAEYQVYRDFDKLIGGRTAIYISHRLSSCRFCDKIVVFHGGQLVEYGDHNELCALDGLYAKMWRAQSQWYVDTSR
jgi:ABC-type multidrug transport system fused ATPase/permease subunit